MRWAAVLLVLVLARAAEQAAVEIRGTVRSASGEPIRDAGVGVAAERTVWAQTSATGSFALQTKGAEFLVAKTDGYRPILLELKATSDPLAIALERAGGTELRLRGRMTMGRIPELRLALPIGVKPQISYDDDHRRTFVFHGSQKKRDGAVLWKAASCPTACHSLAGFASTRSSKFAA